MEGGQTRRYSYTWGKTRIIVYSEDMSAPAGRFQIIRELGRGAMGSVHEAQDTVLGRRVALKLLIQRDRKREKR